MPEGNMQSFVNGDGDLLLRSVLKIARSEIHPRTIGPGHAVATIYNHRRNIQENAGKANVLAYRAAKIARESFLVSHTAPQ
jgi:hypothetical protein